MPAFVRAEYPNGKGNMLSYVFPDEAFFIECDPRQAPGRFAIICCKVDDTVSGIFEFDNPGVTFDEEGQLIDGRDKLKLMQHCTEATLTHKLTPDHPHPIDAYQLKRGAYQIIVEQMVCMTPN